MRAPATPTSREEARKAEKYSPTNMARNKSIVNTITIWVSCVAGAVAGVLGLTKLQGFAFYGLAALLQLVILLTRYHFSVESHFVSVAPLWKEGLTTGMSSFVLIWTLIYNIVHVY